MSAPRVTITRVYLVDCDACGETIDPFGYQTREEAAEVRAAHLAEHEDGAIFSRDDAART